MAFRAYPSIWIRTRWQRRRRIRSTPLEVQALAVGIHCHRRGPSSFLSHPYQQSHDTSRCVPSAQRRRLPFRLHRRFQEGIHLGRGKVVSRTRHASFSIRVGADHAVLERELGQSEDGWAVRSHERYNACSVVREVIQYLLVIVRSASPISTTLYSLLLINDII